MLSADGEVTDAEGRLASALTSDTLWRATAPSSRAGTTRVGQVRSGATFAERVALACLARDVPESSLESRRRAAEEVVQSLTALPDSTRAGVGVAGVLARSVAGRSSGDRLVSRLDGAPLPGVGEYLKLVRSLALVAWFEDVGS